MKAMAGRVADGGANSGANLRAATRLAALTFVLTLAGASLVVGTSWHYLSERRADLAQATRTRDSAADKLRHADSELRDIRTYQPHFAQWRAKGVIGAENRLVWIEAMRQIQAQRRLAPLSYEIEAQQALPQEAPAAAGLRLRGSRMTLHMDLLHEMDLLNFLDDLKAVGLLTVQECAIKRGNPAPGMPLAPLLSADCTLTWLTLGVPAAAPVMP